MNIERLAIPVLAAALLGGCATYGSVGGGVIDEDAFGEANRQTMAAQIIDPDPQYDEPMATSAEHAANAIDRYRNDAVTRPDRVSSSERSSGGNSGSGSNSSSN